MVTLPEEIAFIWRRPKALSAMLFLLNRYLALLFNISNLVLSFVPLSSCTGYWLYRQLSLVSQAVIVCLILTIRTYALYGGSKRLLICLTIIIIGLAISASVESFGRSAGNAVSLPGIGCYETYTTATSVRLGLAWVADMIYELLIFILIVYRVCKTRGLLRSSLANRTNIIDTMFRDGAMYIGAMTLVNIPNVLTFYTTNLVIIEGSLSAMTSCLSVVLISRLMLNLHKSIDAGITSIPAREEGPSLAVFTTRIDVQSAISSHHW
jgi:hypothetical protein